MSVQLSDPIRMIARKAGDVRIHTFVASYQDDNIANATHIIESAEKLVLVDAQFLVPYARQFRDYADSLRKPNGEKKDIDRLYLSHRHPDHWFGVAAAFKDVPVFALAETIEFLKQNGQASLQDHWKMGALAPDDVVIPQHVVEPGGETIDGVRYVFSEVVNTEIDFLLTIELPDLNVAIVQDLIYSGTHLYLTQDMRRWIDVLQTMLLSDCDLFMPGHGLPADRNEVARNMEYLAAALSAAGRGLVNDAFKTFLLNRYPERKCPGIFDIYMPRLFGGARQF